MDFESDSVSESSDNSSFQEPLVDLIQPDRKVHGLLKSYHGIVYQLQWIMVIGLQSFKYGSDSGFRFRTEIEEIDAGKFDDVVWQYRDSQEKYYNFLQCKHKLNANEKITLGDLLKNGGKNQKNNPFSLQKYFISYRDNIKDNNCEKINSYKDGVIQNLIIATNIEFEDALETILILDRTTNPVLKYIKTKFQLKKSKQNKSLKFWKINSSSIPREIRYKLEETYDLIQLAKKLGEHIRTQKKFILPDHLKCYCKALYDHTVDLTEQSLSDNFITGTNLSKQAENLREAFFHEEFIKKRSSFNFLTNHNSIPHPKELAQILATLITQSNDKIVKIRRHTKILREIDSLAGYVFVEDDGIKFNATFWVEHDCAFPNESIKVFRSTLIDNLQLQGVISAEESKSSIATKLADYRFDIKNFKTCRRELIDEKSFWDEAKKFNKFYTRTFRNEGNKDLPNYDVSTLTEEINIFFNLLLFAVNYSKKYLGHIVEKELTENFRFINTEYMAYAFRTEIAKSLDITEDSYISSSEGILKFINTAKQIVNSFILLGPTLEYRFKSDLLGIKFGKQSVNKLKLRHFIFRANEQILLLNAIRVKLSSIKVLQVLSEINEYQINGSYLFMQIDTILCLQDLVNQVFNSKCNLLIIEYDGTINTRDYRLYLEELFENLLCTLNMNTNKKIILIVSDNNYLVEKCITNIETRCKKITDKLNNIMNLTKQSRNEILERANVYFQGEKLSLRTVVADEILHIIKAEILFKVVSDDDLVIGSPICDLGKIEDYYISRSFHQNVFIKKEVLNINEVFAISNVSQPEMSMELSKLAKKSNINKYICLYDRTHSNNILDTKHIILLDSNSTTAEQQFFVLCKKYTNQTLHWIQYDTEYFIWRKSQGPVINLRKHLSKNKIGYEKKENDFLREMKNKRFFILAAEPGMGKSTVATKIALSLKADNKWIIRVNLLHHSTDLKNCAKNNFVIEFLYKIANLRCFETETNFTYFKENILLNISLRDGKLIMNQKRNINSLYLLEIEVFNYLFNRGKVILLLDGYDEICATYEHKVLEFINILRGTMISNILITTRPYNIVYNLENLVSELSFTLKPFDLTDQQEFLIKYWKSNLNLLAIDKHRSAIFINEVLLEFSKATNDSDRDFVSVPLQLRMLADNFQIIFLEYYNAMTAQKLNSFYKIKIKTNLDLIKLYQKFLKIKFAEIRFQEKKPSLNPDDTDILEVMQREYRIFMNDHQRLAVYTLFHDDCFTRILTKYDMLKVKEILTVINKANEKNGIISGIVNNLPIFVHRTFAEYFASSYFWDKFKILNLTDFKNNFLESVIIKRLFSGKYIQTCKFFFLMAKKDSQAEVKFLFKHEKMVALLESLRNIITIICNEYENAGSHLPNGMDYLSDDLFGINRKFEIGYVPCIKLLFKIIEIYLPLLLVDVRNNDVKKLIDEDHTINLLRMAAEIGCLNFSKFFLKVKEYDYEQDLKRRKWYFTPLWLATRNGQLDVVNVLKTKYNPHWVDKDGLCLKCRVFCQNEYNVLHSCLILRILDASPFNDINGGKRLPLVNALNHRYPENIIKILIVLTDVHIINNFRATNELLGPFEIVCNFLGYDDEVLQLAVLSGICYNGVLNLLLFEFSKNSLNEPINCLRYARSLKCSFFNDAEYLKLPKMIEILLRSGVSYNTKCTKYYKYTLQYIKGIYYIQTLLNELLNNSRPVDTLAKVIIQSLPYEKCEIQMYTHQNEICLVYGTERKSLHFIPRNVQKLLEKIKNCSDPQIDTILHNLQVYIEEAKEEIGNFKLYPDSKTYNKILIGYQEMLEYDYFRFDDKIKKLNLFKTLGETENYLFQRLLELHIRQEYNITDAYKEISAEVLKTTELKKWMHEKRVENSSITIEELLEMFDLNQIETSTIIQQITTHIYEIDCINLLHETWSNLSYIGQKRITETIESMVKYSSISTQIYQLLCRLDVSYKELIPAILHENYKDINVALKNVEACYKKAVINAQNDECGSPLHYAVYTENVKLTELLLLHGANPNYKLDGHAVFLSENSENLEDDDSFDEFGFEENYDGFSALHMATLKGNLDIIQLLVKHGADHKVINNWGKTPLQIGVEKQIKTTNLSIYRKIAELGHTNTDRFQISDKDIISGDEEDENGKAVNNVDTVFCNPSTNIRKRKAFNLTEEQNMMIHMNKTTKE